MTAEQLEELLGKVTQGEWRKGTTLNDLDEVATSIMKPKGEVICVVDEDTEENEANGRLIALAPSLARKVIAAERMAEALKDLIDYCGSSQMGCSTWDEEAALTAYREASK
jgi:hypothetical protein